MIRLSVAIQGFFVRAPKVRRLLEQLHYPEITVTAYVDDGSLGCWPNNLRCWQGHPADATHHMLIQDDTILSENFVEAALATIAARPETPICYFSRNTKRVTEAREQGRHWFSGNDIWFHGLVIPAQLSRDFVQWATTTPEVSDYTDQRWGPHDDRRLQWYLRSRKVKTWYTVPSLVEHGSPSDSTLGQSNRNRVAVWFDPAGGASIDWAAEV